MYTEEEMLVAMGLWRPYRCFGESEEARELRILEAKEKSLEFKKMITKKRVRK